MADIKIVVDSGSDIPDELAKEYNIGLIPFLSIFGEESFVSRVEMSNAEFYAKIQETGIIPTTSQYPYQDMYDYLLKESLDHDAVIFYTISSRGSGEYDTAHMIRNEILESDNPNAKIYIVDSRAFSLFSADMAIKAVKMVQNGSSAEEIVEQTSKIKDTWDVLLLVDNLKYLEKGGRINKALAIVGAMLDIRPLISIRNGLMETVGKIRGRKNLISKIIDAVEDDPNFDSEKPNFMVVQSDVEKGDAMVAQLRERFGNDCVSIYSEFGSIIGTHTGPGSIAVIYKLK